MNLDIISTLILILVSIVIGFMLSALISNLRGSNTPRESSPSSQSSPYQEIARLWRNPKNESLLVEIDGEIHPSLDDLNENQKKELAVASGDLRTWLRIFPKPSQINQSSAFTAEMPEEPSSFPSYSPQNTFDEPEKPSLNPFQVFTRAVQESPQQAPSKSIAQQIDDILQAKLENTPFKNRGIRLVELPEEGMVVMVGLEKYKDVEDIPNEEIRNILRDAVEEWEKGETG